jgi:serine/threonine-protein kinase RsbW
MIGSRMREVDGLCLRIRDLLQRNNFGDVCFGVELLARECLNNAVIHGSRNDADKSIGLRLFVGREWIRLQVTDEGAGFNWRKACENQSASTTSSGRGLRLYALYAARMRFNRRGNQITLWVGKGNVKEKDD